MAVTPDQFQAIIDRIDRAAIALMIFQFICYVTLLIAVSRKRK